MTANRSKRSISIRLPESLADELKTRAAEEGISVTEILHRFARLGLRFTTEDRFLPYGGVTDGNGNSHGPSGLGNGSQPLPEESNGYPLSTTQILMGADHEEEETAVSAAEDPEALLAGFEHFVKVLERAMRQLTEERNRDRVEDTIGELAKLKSRLQLDPWFLQKNGDHRPRG